VHTYLSTCCMAKEQQRPAEILSLAEEMGVRTIGFSDHLWANPDIPPSDWYRPQGKGQISKLRADLDGVSTGIRVLVGCEADMIAPGKFGITREFAEELDFVLLSCSHFHMKGSVAQPASTAPRDVARHMLEFFRSGVSSGLATSIAHPLLPCGFYDKFDEAVETISDTEFLDAFGLARDHGVAIEITTAFLPAFSQSQFSIDTPARFLSIARKAGCKFTFGSDAHSPERQERLPELIAIIEAVGVEENDILPMLR
jgi:histidinol phosphatase-like PHP family hydrolase